MSLEFPFIYPTSSHMFCHDCETRVVVGSRFPPSCKRTDPIRCIHPRSGALFGQSMALDGLHKVRKTGAPAVGPRKLPAQRTGRVVEEDWTETAQKLRVGEKKQVNRYTHCQNKNGQVTQNSPPACHPKELQRRLLGRVSGALLCWQRQSACCARECSLTWTNRDMNSISSRNPFQTEATHTHTPFV